MPSEKNPSDRFLHCLILDLINLLLLFWKLLSQRWPFCCRRGTSGKEPACQSRLDLTDLGSSPGTERSPGGGMATHSSILAWWIPWTEEPGRLQSIGFHRAEHDWSDLTWSMVVFRPKSLKSVLILNSKWFAFYMQKLLSHVWLFVTPWAVQSMEFFQARILEWVAIPFSRESSQPRDWTQVSRIAGGFFTIWATREVLLVM